LIIQELLTIQLQRFVVSAIQLRRAVLRDEIEGLYQLCLLYTTVSYILCIFIYIITLRLGIHFAINRINSCADNETGMNVNVSLFEVRHSDFDGSSYRGVQE
jgi:hypothetical protein